LLTQQFIITLLVLLAAVAGGVGLSIYERRPRESLTPSLLPAIPLMLICGLIAILSIVHLLNLIGVKTGS
jgi:hypothetical protein